LLAAAGFPNGIDLDLNWYVTVQTQAIALEQATREGGVRFKLVQDVDLAASQRALTTKSWKDLIIAGRAIAFIDPTATQPVYIKGSSTNFSDTVEEKFEDSWRRLLAAQTADERKKIAREIWDQHLSILPDVPMPRSDTIQYFQPTVRNYVDTSWNAFVGVGQGQMDSIWRA
jgi:hypothetical protein